MASLSDLDPNEPGEWPKSIKALTIFALCLVVWAGGYYFFMIDQLETLKAKEQEEISLKQAYTSKYAKAVNLEAYKEQMEEMKVVFSSMLQQLPRESEVADLLIDISRSGLVNGLEFELFKPSGEHPVDFYAELPIQMKVTGNFHQFGEFVSAVASLPRIVTMHDLTLMPLSGDDPDKMTMNIVAKTYRYFDEQE